MTPALGWIASAILVATIGWQSYQQWKSDDSSGVSLWLFLGQIAANTLFATYAYLQGDAVFLTANLLLLVTSLFGLGVKLHHARRDGELAIT